MKAFAGVIFAVLSIIYGIYVLIDAISHKNMDNDLMFCLLTLLISQVLFKDSLLKNKT